MLRLQSHLDRVSPPRLPTVCTCSRPGKDQARYGTAPGNQ
jgi:hypothetical protein